MTDAIQNLTDGLKNKPTRLLLEELRILRVRDWIDDSTGEPVSWTAYKAGIDNDEMIECYKRELATREHIDNKPEARERRRKAATAHHGSKKRKLKY